jgi:hypothetical protein
VRRATEQCLGLLCTICRWSPELWLAAEGSGGTQYQRDRSGGGNGKFVSHEISPGVSI